jgi:predicted dehydrogenase
MTQPDDRPIRWGILATGGIVHAFAQDLALQPDGEVVAVGSRSQASADAFGDEFGVPHRHAGDGKLSREEAPVLIREQFDRYDTDHDGFITMEDAQRWD